MRTPGLSTAINEATSWAEDIESRLDTAIEMVEGLDLTKILNSEDPADAVNDIECEIESLMNYLNDILRDIQD